jgi:hypothetical protein
LHPLVHPARRRLKEVVLYLLNTLLEILILNRHLK